MRTRTNKRMFMVQAFRAPPTFLQVSVQTRFIGVTIAIRMERKSMTTMSGSEVTFVTGSLLFGAEMELEFVVFGDVILISKTRFSCKISVKVKIQGEPYYPTKDNRAFVILEN